MVVDGAACPMPTVVALSSTVNPTPIASWGVFGAWVMNTAFQSPVVGKSVIAT